MTVCIKFQDVSVRRAKTEALSSVNFEVSNGQIVGLLGPSGAGKSTIMRSIVGVQNGVTGSVEVLGKKSGSVDLATRVAYSTQQSSVFDDLSVTQNLLYTAAILGLDKKRVPQVISTVKLEGYEKAKVRDLSGGQKSRVSLAMALIGDPELLVLDEPTVGLDPVLRAELWGLFRKLANQGKTLLVSSHVMDEAERCDQIIFVRAGKVIAFDTLANILKHTKTKSAEEAFLVLAGGVK